MPDTAYQTIHPDAAGEIVALAEPELIEQFADFKTIYEGENGEELSEKFVVKKEAAEKAKKRLKARLKGRSAEGSKTVSDVVFEDESGTVVAQLEGVVTHLVPSRSSAAPS